MYSCIVDYPTMNDPESKKTRDNYNLAIGQDVPVIFRSVDTLKIVPRKLPQYIASLSATLGALAAGLVYGWTSPAGEDGGNLKYDFEITSEDFSWISSIYNIGAGAICIPIGILTNLIGRRRSMLLMTIPFIIGWACVIWPSSVWTLIFGRFLLGVSGGAFCVAAPMYTAEIADKETRGRLGSYFELLLCLGILIAYTLGLLNDMYIQSMISASVPFMFFAIFFFMPETPMYHLTKGDVSAAREILVWLRGQNYDVEYELAEQRKMLADAEHNCVPLITALRSRAAIKGIFIAYGLMFFQCFSGVDVIIFYAKDIFRDATGRDSDWSAIVISTMQVTAVFLFTLVVDKWGRRVSLVFSGTVTCLATLILGIYFYLDKNFTSMDNYRSLPIICMSAFNIAISFGLDPIPWMMIGELFSPRVKGVAGSSACLLNWLMSFVVTKFYSAVKRVIGPYGAFWIFSAVCGISVFFVVFFVPETKGKSLDQIQVELSGSSVRYCNSTNKVASPNTAGDYEKKS